MNIKRVLTIGGAFTAYCIGTGVASGQEILQFYGSWPGSTPFFLVALGFILMLLFCIGTYKTGAIKQFKDPNEAYTYYCGPHLGRLIDYFCTLSLGLCTLIMFAGSGAALNQYLGIPVYVGTIFMGIVAVIVVCLGLQKVVDVLGCAGIIIIAITVVAGIYCITTSSITIPEAQQHLPEYIANGSILQGKFMGIDNCVIAMFSLIGAYITLGVLFNVSLGYSIKNNTEVLASAFCSTILYYAGILMVLLTLIKNLDYIAAIKAQIPMLAAIENNIPVLAFPFTFVIVIGIFTTIVGYLWAFGRRFAEDKTKKQRIIVIVVTLIGVTVASFIPLAQLVNAIYPVVGIAGVLLLIGIIYRMFTDKEGFHDDVAETFAPANTNTSTTDR